MQKMQHPEDVLERTDEVGYISVIPRISIQVFCESTDVAGTIRNSEADRRMGRANIKVQMGGVVAAVEAYRSAPTPNVVVLESISGDRQQTLQALDVLAEYCDSGTKLVVIGHVNDVLLYRELIRRGVSEYLIAPFSILQFIKCISDIYNAPGAEPLGRTVAVVGTKGGVGSSTIAHNLAWTIARSHSINTVLVDLDLAFGTAGLNFNQDPPQGIAEAIFAPERLDGTMLDRLLSKCSDNLSLLASPATLDRAYDFSETAFDPVLDVLKNMTPYIVLDMPHQWTAWSRRTLVSADDILIVSAPDLGNLRNARTIIDVVRLARPNDRVAKIVLNMVGMAKRPEIAPTDFAKALECDLAAVVPFDAQLFGTAANNGQMISELQPSGKIIDIFQSLARSLIGREETIRNSNSILRPILSKFRRKI